MNEPHSNPSSHETEGLLPAWTAQGRTWLGLALLAVAAVIFASSLPVRLNPVPFAIAVVLGGLGGFSLVAAAVATGIKLARVDVPRRD